LKFSAHLDLGDYLPYLANRFGAALVEWFSVHALAERNLSIAMWRVLAVLANDDRQRLTDLARLTSIEISTLSRLVTRLVSLGFIERSRRTTNSREVIVRLTAKGAEIAAEMIPIAQELEAAAVAGMSQKDVVAVKRSLRKMHDNLASRMRVPAKPVKRRDGHRLLASRRKS
jgi:MarR family transcriptional regulator, organic hydroperoxide resistance regulator